MLRKVLFALATFAFQFTIAVYLLAVPAYALTHAGDALLPWEASFVTFLSGIMFSKSFIPVWKVLKS